MTITTRHAAELLAYVRYGLGFTPTDSVVIVGIMGADGSPGVAARMDHADAITGPLTPSPTARDTMRLAAEAGDALALIVYATDGEAAEATLAALTLHAPAPVAGTVWASPTHYATGDGQARPVTDLDATATAAEMVTAGRTVAESRQDVAASFAPAPEPARAEAADALADALAAAVTYPAHAPDVEARTAWEAVTADPTPTAHGRLAAVLTDKDARDVLIGYMLAGTWAQGLDPAIMGTDRDRENSARIDAALPVLAATAAHVPEGAADPLATAGFLAWWVGDGGRANVYVAAALDLDPGHRLAQLAHHALSSHTPPPWVVSQRVA